MRKALDLRVNTVLLGNITEQLIVLDHVIHVGWDHIFPTTRIGADHFQHLFAEDV